MMDIHALIAADKAHYMNTFGERIPLSFSHGEGCALFDQEGNRYLDFLGGIAVNALGYGEAGFLAAVKSQLERLIHCSNYFYNEPQTLLAKALCENSCADRVFFTNSGAEANEGAMKLARAHFYKKGRPREGFVSALKSFHGRTIATVSATGQEKYQKPFAPLLSGVTHVPFNDVDALKAAVTENTAGVILECVQGEGGVWPADAEYLRFARDLCDKTGALLIFDEVQTGMGRTGKLFGYQHYGVEPDIFTLAKALGNGLPIGAVLCKDFCAAFQPGDHGTTFGGNPLCCAAGLYVINRISSPGFLQSVSEKGAMLKATLTALMPVCPNIVDVRGIGLMIGIQLAQKRPVKEASAKLRELGFIVGTADGNTLRLLPPLVMEERALLSIVPAIKTAVSEV
ncbi:MAG: aspartate aminotransferase family protein [Christensenellales bacterium]